MKTILLMTTSLLTFGCATPRAWVISQYKGGGIIGYQNYNPANDNGIKIKKLLQCQDHRMTSNPLKTGYIPPSAYQAYNNGYGMTTVYPLDGGYYEWREYHYTCNDSRLYKSESQNNEISADDCKKSCEDMKVNGELVYWMSITECIRRLCDH